MKHFIYTLFLLLPLSGVSAQENNFTVLVNNPSTNVKNQFASLACWDYACTSMTESELLKSNNVRIDLSEAFTVYNTYIDKATKYINTRGRTFFNKGGIGEDVLNIIDKYGAMPEEIYPGIGRDTIMNNEALMYPLLKAYLDNILSKTRAKSLWTGKVIL